MATIQYGSGTSVGYLTTEDPSMLTVSADRLQVSRPEWKVKGLASTSSDTRARYFRFGTDRVSQITLWNPHTDFRVVYANQNTNTVSNPSTWATLPSANSPVINTADLFNEDNKDERIVELVFSVPTITAYITNGGWIEQSSVVGAISAAKAKIKLDAPPTFSVSEITYDGVNPPCVGYTTASITVSDVTAYYGADISSIVFAIGNQTATRANAGTLSILLNAEGEFTPVVTVTDSRGQTASTSLNKIYVNGYISPSIDFNDLDRVLGTYKLTEDNEVVANKAYYSRTGTGSTAHPFVYTQEHPVSPANPHTLGYYEETNAKGTEDDEGTSAVIEITPTFTRAIAYLEEPTLQVDGETSSSSNPPITWYTDRALTNAVNWSDYKPAEGTHLYGYIADIFDTQLSYQIGLIPHDSIGDGTLKTQTLAPAFYTVDFLAGGHGIAFGQPCDEEGFWCNMEAHFVDANNVMRALLDLVHPVGSYYETSKTPTEFNPNNVWGGTWVSETIKNVHVVEEGTTSDWTYRKWSDGTAECWKKISLASGSFTATGNVYYRSASGYGLPSGLFNVAPAIEVNADMGNVGSASALNITASSFAIYTMSAVSTARAVSFSVYAVGTWKTFTAPTTKYRWHRTA